MREWDKRMNSSHLPYLILAFASLAAILEVRAIASALILIAAATALAVSSIEWLSLLWIAFLFASMWLSENGQLPRVWRGLASIGFGILAVLLSQHLLPGFNNLIVFDRVQFAQDSVPFTMYLNFDKPLVGLCVFLFFVQRKQAAWTPKKAWLTFGCWAFITVLLMLLALSANFVRFDPKWPKDGWLWAANNFFFVCLAEEGLFRGYIQGGLQRLFPKNRIFAFLAIFSASVLFGLAHFRGGVTYVLFSTIAGFIYGFTYWKTQRLEAAMLVHFGLNVVHFVGFSYPALLIPNL